MKQLNWYEVWTDSGTMPPYVLMLLCFGDNEFFQIYDPVEQRNCYECTDYQAAAYWLLEDEYVKVAGKMYPNDYS